MQYTPAGNRDIPSIVAMHIDPSRDGIANIYKNSSRYSFYQDKIKFYYEVENEGLIVAKDGDRVEGFIIVTKSIKQINKMILRKGYALRWFLKTLIGRYGIDGAICFKLQNIILTLISNLPNLTRGMNENVVPDSKIMAIVVLKEKRNQGVGTELVNKACVYLTEQGIHEILVTTSVSNLNAQRFYKDIGFTEIGIYRDTIGKSVYMTKQF